MSSAEKLSSIKIDWESVMDLINNRINTYSMQWMMWSMHKENYLKNV